jgi:hypothetical protein
MVGWFVTRKTNALDDAPFACHHRSARVLHDNAA